jgi:myo-inositol 2-dehydrogenase / D-chiro-inositol 1-dehydrogenase
MGTKKESGMNRRGFVKAATAATAGVLLVKPSVAFGTAANSALQVGIIGSGSRGPWIGNFFQQHTNSKVVALADYYRDRLDAAGQRLGVPKDRHYIGFDAYQELLASDVDAVAVESPPYFHPEQTVAALEAGKHVYLAKPIAVDAAGCRAIVNAVAKVNGKQSILVDFQTRNDPLFREAAQLVHDGKIGKPTCGQAYYHVDRLPLKAPPGTELARLRNWWFDIALSGDIIVEQNIHVIDVANWFFNGHPVKARGTGGRKVRVDAGDNWDHFIVTYEYGDGALLDFSSNQFAPGFGDLCTRVYGSEGTVDAHYGGQVTIGSKSGTWPGGVTSSIYAQGAINNVIDFHKAITEGTHVNNAEESSNSTLTSIMGRVAAHENREVTWDEIVQSDDRLDPKLDLPKGGTDWKPEAV